MMKSKTKQKKIDPDAWYSLQDIVREKMFGWAKSFSTVRRVVELDMQGKNILKAMIQGEGRAKKYQFKGENIINFIKQAESGKIR